jgi:transcriptional antiterminator RfaH
MASHLRVWFGVPVFCPRIRFGKIIRKVRMWVTEPLFPGYFFAQFDSERILAAALAVCEVPDVVKSGDRYAKMPEELISELRQLTRATEDGSLGAALVSGERWRVTNKTGNAMQAVILQILPGRERIELLLKVLQQDVSAPFSADDSISSDPGQRNLLELTARVKVLSARRNPGCEALRS